MNWISVDDRLPETADDVLAYSPDEGCYRAWCDNNIWFSHESVNNNKPTHWMKMPAIPSQQVPNPRSCYGMTDKLVTSETRPYSVWSETMDTAQDIKDAWEARFGGPYKIVKSHQGYEVKYMGSWKNDPNIMRSSQ